MVTMLLFIVLADTWSEIITSPRLKESAETIAATTAAAGTLIALIGWIIAKMIRPLYKILSNMREMYSTHEFVLTEVAKIKDTNSTLKLISEQVEKNSIEIKALIHKTTKQVLVTAIKAHMLYDESPIARFECDLHGKCTWTNAAFQKIWGLPASELLDDGGFRCIHPDDVARIEQSWRLAVDHGIPYTARFRVINQETQEESYVEVKSDIIKDDFDEPLCIWGKATKIPKSIIT